MRLSELKKTEPATMKSSGTDDPKKYVGKWEVYDKPQGINDRRDRKVLAKEAGQDVPRMDPMQVLAKASPTAYKGVRATRKKMSQQTEAGLGMTVAFILITLAGEPIAQVGPFDFSGARDMERTIEADLARSYENTHPNGFTDGSGAIFMLDDWDVSIQSCHSSECAQVSREIQDQIDARRQRLNMDG